MNRLNPLAQLEAAFRESHAACAFAASSPRQAVAWQRRTRSALVKCLGLDRLRRVAANPRIVQEVDRGSHIQRKIILASTAHSDVPVYLLLPKVRRRPLPCVLALHGHGYGAKAIVGICEDGGYRDQPAGYQRDFAVELVRRGLVVAAPEICCFGEREATYGHLPEHTPRPSTCHNISTYAMMLGLSVPGMRTWDGMRVLDYMQTLPEVDPGAIGVMGISGGGMHAFFSACVDTRIRAAVISGYFCDWRKSILAINHCTCNFVPGLMQLGELSDLAALIAPRPLLVEHGRHDAIFPVRDVEETVARANKAWRLLGDEMIRTDFFRDGHRINGKKAYPFLQRQLGSSDPSRSPATHLRVSRGRTR